MVLLPAGLAWGQAPTITAVGPLANAPAAPRATAVTATFSQSLTAASTGALQVFSSQRGGRRTSSTPATVSGNTLSFVPRAYDFRPGETVNYTITQAAASSGGTLARPRVGQFTVATGPATGQFTNLANAVPFYTIPTRCIRPADVDGDGDLDLLIANLDGSPATGTTPAVPGSVTIALNNGRGIFAVGGSVSVCPRPSDLAVADVDGDGDLDLLVSGYCTTCTQATTVSVRLNNGAGTYSGTQEVSVGNGPIRLTVGDWDGDGDLDLATSNSGTSGQAGSTVSVRFNDGGGIYTGNQELAVGTNPGALQAGDLDGDGDLDLVVATDAALVARLNNGSGVFATMQTLDSPDAMYPFDTDFALTDLDGDHDLDIALVKLDMYRHYGNVQLLMNSGNSAFPVAASQFLGGINVAAGDIDGDGDSDLVFTYPTPTGTPGNPSPAFACFYFNNGTGQFNPTYTRVNIPVFYNYFAPVFTLADVDGDTDVDFIASAEGAGSQAFIFTNNGSGPLAAAPAQAAASLAIFPNPARTVATLTGAVPNTRVIAYDALGRVALTTSTDASGNAQLPLAETLAPGLYLVRCGSLTTKLVLQ